MPPHAFTHSESTNGDSLLVEVTSTSHSIVSNDEINRILASHAPSSPQSPPPRAITHARKNVSFALEENQVFEHIHINDLEQEVDINTIWYTHDEFQHMIRDCLATISKFVDLMMHGQQHEPIPHYDTININATTTNDDETWCSRGLELDIDVKLEKVDEHYVSVRNRRIQQSKNAVFEEQDIQRIEGIHDDELLAAMYYGCNFECQLEAEQVANADCEEVLLVQD